MGNNQSSEKCCVICLGKPPEKVDDGEWLDVPQDKKKRRKSKKSRSKSKKNLDKMPILPEESDICNETMDENDTTDTSPTKPSSPLSDNNSSTSPPARRSSQGDEKIFTKINTKRQPKVKLTFVNGQFVDLKTIEGQEIVQAAYSSSSDEGESGRRAAIQGIIISHPSGHRGILCASSHSSLTASFSGGYRPSSPSPKIAAQAISKMASLTSFSRAKSDASASTSSIESDSVSSRQMSTFDSDLDDGKNAVTSIVALGNRFFLTASKCDRVIKMWNLTNNNELEHVRDFVGHSTAVTCLVKVDEKGRFLSASKDREIRLWDSRFNCDNTYDDDRLLLAVFKEIDSRSIQSIAMLNDGKYVRPTDKVDMAMAAALTKKAMKDGSMAVTKAAKERHIIGCTCELATITKRHPVVKVWTVTQVNQDEDKLSKESNVAEVKLSQELEHDAVVESITSVSKKNMMLSGDRLGVVRLWISVKNVFLPNSPRIWSISRTFLHGKPDLCTVGENMSFGITSLTFLRENTMFVSGSRSGDMRVWKVGTTKTSSSIYKEDICISGAHTSRITSLQQGPTVEKSSLLSFSSASEDGKVLSFALPATGKKGSPRCFNAVHHGIANRYFPELEHISVTALACLSTFGDSTQILISGTSNTNGSINVLQPSQLTTSGNQLDDALILHRRHIEEETLTLYSMAKKLSKGIECKTRKKNMKTYKNCFLGSDAVSYLVDNNFAASREEACALGHVLATHLCLFDCVTKSGKFLEDNASSYYRFADDEVEDDVRKSKTMKKWSTAPNLESSFMS